MEPWIILGFCGIAVVLGIAVGRLTGRRPSEDPQKEDDPRHFDLVHSERLTAMRDRVERAVDSADTAEKLAVKTSEELSQKSSSLGGQISKLKGRVTELETLLNGFALARSGVLGPPGGDGSDQQTQAATPRPQQRQQDPSDFLPSMFEEFEE